MFCSKCGKEIEETDAYCRFCGGSTTLAPAGQVVARFSSPWGFLWRRFATVTEVLKTVFVNPYEGKDVMLGGAGLTIVGIILAFLFSFSPSAVGFFVFITLLGIGSLIYGMVRRFHSKMD